MNLRAPDLPKVRYFWKQTDQKRVNRGLELLHQYGKITDEQYDLYNRLNQDDENRNNRELAAAVVEAFRVKYSLDDNPG